MVGSTQSTDWFGAKKLATLFKRDEGHMPSATDVPNPSDPTSLAYKGKPAGADLYVATAKLYEKQNNIPAAEDQYQRALKLTPTDVPALVGYAHLLDRQGKLEQATAYYTQAVQLAPDNAAVHNDLGLCLARRGMLNESQAELTKAIELEPEKKLYRNNIATVLVEMGQRERAFEHMLAGQTPATAHYNLACLLHERGQTQAAAYHFSQAAANDPSMVAAQEWAGKLGAGHAAPRLTDARPVEQATPYHPNTQWTQPASAQIADTPAPGGGRTSGATNSMSGWPKSGAERNWAAYDSSRSAGGIASSSDTGIQDGINAASRGLGSAYATAPTPETAGNYRLPATASSDALPPLESSLPRY
jgi:Flp pilus assembly protein TadD